MVISMHGYYLILWKEQMRADEVSAALARARTQAGTVLNSIHVS